MKKLVRFNLMIVLLFTLVACGGGDDSGSDTDTDSQVPSVNAGLDQEVNELLPTVITAVGFPDGGSYAWTQVGGPTVAEFPSTESSVSWTVPATKTEQEISFRIDYTAPSGTVVSDTVTIQVAPVNAPPVAVATQQAPLSDPVAPRSTVVLDGSGSFDQDADGSIIAYNWVQQGSVPVIPLNQNNLVEFSFIAPQVNSKTQFNFQLTVTDDEGATGQYDLTVTVDPNLTLVSVSGGADQVVNEEQLVSLSATGDPLGGTFSWSQSSGDNLSEFPASGASITFTTPATKSIKNYVFNVEYQSPEGFVGHDSVSVIVNPVNKLPTADVRFLTPDSLHPIKANELVTLDGSVSTDLDGEIVDYSWSQLSGSVNIIPETSVDPSLHKFRAPVQENDESYVVRLIVTDDEGGTGTFDQEIEIGGSADLIIADAGSDQVVDEFSTVTLNGLGSFSSRSPVTCSWRLVAGPTVSFTNPNSCISTFVAPNVDVDTPLIFELTATNDFDDQTTDPTTVTVQPIALGNIADTGQTACYDHSQAIPCNDTQYPRQDGDFGRDSVAAFLDKAGTGSGGFDYTKLDANGDELSDNDSNYACVRDNATGLIWELKTRSVDAVPNTTLRDNKNTYSWSYADGSTGGETGVPSERQTSCPSELDCGMGTFVNEVNESVYCGGSNWRVPTMLELQSIVNYSQNDGAIDSNIFNDLPDKSLQGHQNFWTAETSADGGGKESSWVIDFATGNDNALPKPTNAYIRLLRED